MFGIKDICIAFSYWKGPDSKEPEVSDVFDVYRIIVNEVAPNKGKKQLIFIDDLDRIRDKSSIIGFLKELYRFQDSMTDNRDSFVFIVSVKPESKLLNNRDDLSDVYPKIFDSVIFLKPIHFDDYDSILIQMIKSEPQKKEALEALISEKIEDTLPEAFNWVKRGSNLTLRELKQRLNHAILIMVSLVNQSYEDNSAANFKACTAVAYLESRFSRDYYELIENEVAFVQFMNKGMPIVNDLNSDRMKSLTALFAELFCANSFSEDFIKDLCSMVIDGVFDDDFRMYFYTYPQGSHIKTTAEKEICDFLSFPNIYSDYDSLSEAVRRAFSESSNSTVEKSIKALKSYPLALLKDDTLFAKAAEISIEKACDAMCKYCSDTIDDEDVDTDIWKRILILDSYPQAYCVNALIDSILKKKSNKNVVTFRKMLIQSLAEKVTIFKALFIGETVPIISQEEIELIDNTVVSVDLINVNKLTFENYPYITQEITSVSLKEQNINTFHKALEILTEYSRIIRGDVSKEALAFLHINHYLDDVVFAGICASAEEKSLIEYINSFKADELSDKYLEEIDKRCVPSGFSKDLILRLLSRNLYVTAIAHLATNNFENGWDVLEKESKAVLGACEEINKKNPDLIINIRWEAYVMLRHKEYLPLYKAPYKLITDEEIFYINPTKDVIFAIDIERIEEDNYRIIESLNKKKYTHKDLLTLLEHLFDKSIVPKDKLEVVWNKLDFAKLNNKKLSVYERGRIHTLLKDSIQIESEEEIIAFFNKLKGFVPSLEKEIQSSEKYSGLINKYDEFTDVTLAWLDKNYITCGLSEKLSSILLERGDYENYIIATSLRERKLNMISSISAEYYNNVYRESEEMFELMSSNMDYLEIFQHSAVFSEFDYEHIEKAFKSRQHKRFFNHINQLNQPIKTKYFSTFGKLASLDDNKAFRKMICEVQNIELLGDWNIYYHIKEQLWDDAPQEKAQFTKAWNKRWKAELGER